MENILQKIKKNKIEVTFALLFIVYTICAIVLFKKNPYHLVSTFPAASITLTLFFGFLLIMMMLFLKQRKNLFGKAATEKESNNQRNPLIIPSHDHSQHSRSN